MADAKQKKNVKWMVMIYLAGDNNLSESMAGSFKDFGSTYWDFPSKPDEVGVLVYFDGGGLDTPTFFCDFTNPDQPIVESMPDSNSANSASIGNFFGWCQEKYIAERHVLFLSGHSDGFQGVSLLKDESSGKAMEIKHLRKTLERAKGPKYFGKKFDILCFDSCVMSMAEVAYEFREAANILIASQGFLPITGLNYRNALFDLGLADRRIHKHQPKCHNYSLVCNCFV